MTFLAALAVAFLAAAAVLAVGQRLSGPAGLPSPRRRRARRTSAAGARIRPILARAGIPWDPDLVLAATAAASAFAAALALAAGTSGVVVLVAGIVPPAAVVQAVRSAGRRYPDRVAGQLPALARHVADGLRAGLSLRQALVRAASDAPEPIRGEVERVVADLSQGARAEDGLDELAARVPHPDVEITVCAILVNLRGGGDLARILGDLASRLEERRRLAAELATATAQARMSAWLVAALPLVAGFAVELLAPGTLGRTLANGAGRAVAAVSAALFASGLLAVRRLSRVPA